jgi:tRNA(Ile)-lysidine synthase TilS/MesJ
MCETFTPYSYRGEKQLEDIVKPFRNRSKYDCIVALSGGRDSTYVLHYVVSKLALNPLAVTCDNGFMPEQTKRNIANAVKCTGVDHVYVAHSYTESSFRPFLLAWKNRPDPAMISFLLGMVANPKCRLQNLY